MRIRTTLLACMALVMTSAAVFGAELSQPATGDLARDFKNPPESTKPRCYWYWFCGNISREGITYDLEAMKRVGIGEAYIGIIYGGGELKALSEPWWQMLDHAVREATRIGVDIGLFNSPGWSQSGGPWIKPEQAMRYMSTLETRVARGKHFEGKLSQPQGEFQDLTVLASLHNVKMRSRLRPGEDCWPYFAKASLNHARRIVLSGMSRSTQVSV